MRLPKLAVAQILAGPVCGCSSLELVRSEGPVDARGPAKEGAAGGEPSAWQGASCCLVALGFSPGRTSLVHLRIAATPRDPPSLFHHQTTVSSRFAPGMVASLSPLFSRTLRSSHTVSFGLAPAAAMEQPLCQLEATDAKRHLLAQNPPHGGPVETNWRLDPDRSGPAGGTAEGSLGRRANADKCAEAGPTPE